MSGTPIDTYTPPPMLGQHTETVLHDLLDMSSADIDALRSRKVI
jgi:crotonobetainyl-CoA:carnitine CoA-transferase CaiB-like acyl-CoA transferase